jgi:hypothetical protein
MERDAGRPMRTAQSKGVGGDILSGRRGAQPTIYRPKYPTNYPLHLNIFMKEIFYWIKSSECPDTGK